MISCLHVIQSSPERVSLECWLRSNVLNLEWQMIGWVFQATDCRCSAQHLLT